MDKNLLRNESPAEYFKDLVEVAMARQHLAVHDVTSFYLVNLLTGYVRVDRSSSMLGEPLGVRLLHALHAGGARQRDELREVGDCSLLISGFFSDSLNRRLVDVDYYVHLGEYAYGSLARQQHHALADVFDELADKFSACVDVLEEVSERCALSSNSDVLRLYEKWLRTGSARSRDLLGERGIVPTSQPGSHRIQ